MTEKVSLADLTFNPNVQGPLWSHGGAQLDVNLLYFDEGNGVPVHVNHTLDVLVVVVQGRGEAEVDSERYVLKPGTCLYIPSGSTRAIRSTGGPLVYASAHCKRDKLMPN
ncbi:MAG: cupin domain-containing protein [Chloroflexota bacterium]|nr:cupin domain-containing protein [Chloroflexota bacterium]